MNVLEEIWAGGLESESSPCDPKYRKGQNAQNKCVDKFMETLTKEQRQMVQELEIGEMTLRAREDEALFIYSFRQGAMMMLDILRPM